jgi:hypothetical protein
MLDQVDGELAAAVAQQGAGVVCSVLCSCPAPLVAGFLEAGLELESIG